VLRLVAIAIFGLMFLAEAGDIYGLVLTLADPEPSAPRFGIAAGAEVIRSSVLLLCALVVAVACTAGYLVYGLFQVADGALQVGAGIVVVAGLIYIVLGGIAYAMHRSAF
jgi:hypothetical protein